MNSLLDCIIFGVFVWWLQLSYKLSAFSEYAHFINEFRKEVLCQIIARKSRRNPRALLMPLVVALRHGDEATVNLMLHHGAPTDLVYRSSSDSCLHAAIKGFRLHKDEATCFRLCEKLLDLGSPLDHRNSFKETPLLLALDRRIGSVADLLITRGANIHLKDSAGRSPLHVAILNSFPVDDIPRRLLDAGANPNDTDLMGASVLKYAVRAQSYDAVKLLLERGADCKTSSQALMMAVRVYGLNGILELLLSNGADVNLEYRGELPLEYLYYNFNFIQPMATVVAHIALLVSQDRHVSRENLRLINDTVVKILYQQYLSELNIMKTTAVCEDSPVSYFDLLTKTGKDLARCLQRNETLRLVVTSADDLFKDDKIFYFYRRSLQLNLETGLRLFHMLEELEELLQDILGNRVPYEIIEKLCQYFDDKELKIVFRDIPGSVL